MLLFTKLTSDPETRKVSWYTLYPLYIDTEIDEDLVPAEQVEPQNDVERARALSDGYMAILKRWTEESNEI